MAYRIVTDTCCDFPDQIYENLNLAVVPLTVNYMGENINAYTEDWLKDMFAGLRSGETASTSAANPQDWHDVLEPILQGGEDALVLTFSSGLSTTYQSAVIAATELAETYPDRTVKVVDTLCASLGQGLFVHYACQKRDAGLSLEDFLKRGGRISAATAVVGTMLQIKPILHVDENGKLINMAKARGRKASIEALAKKMGELQIPGANDTVYICHGDCMEDAQYLEKLVRQQYGVKNVLIYYVGAVIGSHSGPGTLALFFLGNQR